MKNKKKKLAGGAILILAAMLLAHTAVAMLDTTVKCQSLSGVDDETGANLIDGDIIQIVCTGADGSIDLPDSNGNPTDDDWLVDTTYAGCGFPFEPNSGKFDKVIDTSNLNVGDIIYCRAWNDAAIADAAYYGDSGTYTIIGGETEIHDFGMWPTNTFFREPPVNEPPVADPNEPYTGTEGVSITFDGSGSYDTDGSVVSYDWDFGDGNIAAGVSPSNTYAQDGTYTVTLTVTDDDAATDTKTTTATVADTEPGAEFSAASTSGLEPLTVTFTDASASYDGIVSRKWNFGDGGTSTEQNPTHLYTKSGVYTVSLMVHEADGDSNTETKVDYVTVADTEPTAEFAATPTSGLKPLTVTFTDASSSYDGITSREWNFGDGGTSTEQNPTHVYTEAGTYTVSLTVHESDGDCDTETKVDYITVTAPAMHIASIDMSTTKYKAKGWHTYATAAVTVVDADGNAVEGATVEGHWSGLTSDTDSGATGADGKAALDSDSVKNAKGTFTFMIDNVVLSGWTYDSASNMETSDSITV